jgi:bifunctional DNase/RNase
VVRVEVFQVGRVQGSSDHLLLLKATDEDRVLPIQVGPFEAMSIAMGVSGVAAPRPMPYDLLANVITRLGGSLERVVIHDVRDGAFIGQLEIGTRNGIIEVDCRPSDAVALAVRTESPIFVTEDVMNQAATPLGGVESEGPEDTGVID